jgi:hypothetical protein
MVIGGIVWRLLLSLLFLLARLCHAAAGDMAPCPWWVKGYLYGGYGRSSIVFFSLHDWPTTGYRSIAFFLFKYLRFKWM